MGARVSFNAHVESHAFDSMDRGRPMPAPPQKPQRVVSWSAAEVRRLGVEVRTSGLTVEGFTSMLPLGLRLQVVCTRCRKPCDVETDGQGAELHESKKPCPVCKQELELRVVPQI